MDDRKDLETEKKEGNLDGRRAFLRKSLYAAYATPFIMALLVQKANAAQSWNPGRGRRPDNNGTPPWHSPDGVPPAQG